mgnify:CR=1 FL=1
MESKFIEHSSINDGIEDGNVATAAITVKPVNKFIYGVQNEDSDVQFFTVDKDTQA